MQCTQMQNLLLTCPQMNAGLPDQLEGSIFLCGRPSTPAQQTYDGALAHLMLFDSPLSTQQINMLYRAYVLTGELPLKLSCWQYVSVPYYV